MSDDFEEEPILWIPNEVSNFIPEFVETVPWGEIDRDTQLDLLASIAKKLHRTAVEPPDEMKLVSVDPRSLVGMTGRDVFPSRVAEYTQIWLEDPEAFPPVVIDSDRKRNRLVEGGHRVVAAVEANVSRVKAFDIGRKAK